MSIRVVDRVWVVRVDSWLVVWVSAISAFYVIILARLFGRCSANNMWREISDSGRNLSIRNTAMKVEYHFRRFRLC